MSYKLNWKEMSLKGKLEYIWEYYRLPILLISCVVIFALSVLSKSFGDKEPLLNVLMVNSNLAEAPSKEGFEDFFSETGYEIGDGDVQCNVSLNFTEGKDEKEHEIVNMENYQLLSTWVLSGDYDVFFGTGNPFVNFAEQGALLDLSTILTEEYIVKNEANLLYVDRDGKIEPYPCAVFLEDNQWLREHGYEKGCYFGIFKGGKNQETALRFAKYILTQQIKEER